MALFNGGYPASYQPMYQPFAQPYTPMQNQTQNVAPVQNSVQGGLIWVTGEAGAKAYLVAPNTTVALYDSEDQTIYLKSADASGMPSMKVLDYTIRETAQNGPNKRVHSQDGGIVDYATKEDLRALSERITAIQKKLSEMEVPEA